MHESIHRWHLSMPLCFRFYRLMNVTIGKLYQRKKHRLIDALIDLDVFIELSEKEKLHRHVT